jgi:hypothetical protein
MMAIVVIILAVNLRKTYGPKGCAYRRGSRPRGAAAGWLHMTGPIRLTSTAVLSAVFVVIFASAAVVAKLNYPAEAASMPLFIGGSGRR